MTIIERYLRFIAIVLLLCAANESSAQLSKGQRKQVGKEAKALAKEGWRPSPGNSSIEQQLENMYSFRIAHNEVMDSKYIMGEGRGVSIDYATAKMEALEFAKIELAGLIKTEVKSIFEEHISNKQINASEAETNSLIEMYIKTHILQKLGRTIPLMELYRTVANSEMEVLVRLAYKNENLNEELKDDLEQIVEQIKK